VELLALGLTVLVHIVGLGTLVYVLLRNDGIDWRSWWPSDDDGHDPPAPDAPHGPPSGGDGVPLGDAGAARVRLREPGRLADAYPPAPRRPAHAPEPAHVPEPAHAPEPAAR
jgi:hypothetical protein